MIARQFRKAPIDRTDNGVGVEWIGEGAGGVCPSFSGQPASSVAVVAARHSIAVQHGCGIIDRHHGAARGHGGTHPASRTCTTAHDCHEPRSGAVMSSSRMLDSFCGSRKAGEVGGKGRGGGVL